MDLLSVGVASCNGLHGVVSSNDKQGKTPFLKPTLKQSASTGITEGFFTTKVMKKIERENNLILNKIVIKQKNIGRGKSSYVHYAMYNQFEIALKEYKFKDDEFNEATMCEFENELNILKLLNHQNIIRLLGFHLNINRKVLKLGFEFCKNGNLFQLIHPILINPNNNNNYQYKNILNMLYDIANGMKYVHTLNIIHCDLKPQNILLFDQFKVKITDFGQSTFVDTDYFNFEEYHQFKPVGTCGYKAPEIINIDKKNGYNYKIDIFSFGCICYELYSRQYLSGIAHLKNYINIKYGHHLKLIPKDCPKKLKFLITKCWQFLPEKRPNFEQIVDEMHKIII